MAEPVLEFEQVSKVFCRDLKRSLWYGLTDVARDLLLLERSTRDLRRDEFWALKNVSFSLSRGETLGVIGRNGAGKSTLLKLVNGLIKPDTGKITIQGKVGALIELGAGFNPILTGRENVYVNASVLGIDRDFIDARLDEIIAFAELGEFIDAPVQSYSSGMKVRLGFSVASTLEPDLLVIDEILAVGDAAFREKCYQRLIDYKNRGGTLLFVSHSAQAVEAVSDRVLLLRSGGAPAEMGDPRSMIAAYEHEARASVSTRVLPSNQDVFLRSLRCRDSKGVLRERFQFREDLFIEFDYENAIPLTDPRFWLQLEKVGDDCPLLEANMLNDGTALGEIAPGQGSVSCRFKNLALTPGVYVVTAGIRRLLTGYMGRKHYAVGQRLGTFEIAPESFLEHCSTMPASSLPGLPPLHVDYAWEQVPQGAHPEVSSAPQTLDQDREGDSVDQPADTNHA